MALTDPRLVLTTPKDGVIGLPDRLTGTNTTSRKPIDLRTVVDLSERMVGWEQPKSRSEIVPPILWWRSSGSMCAGYLVGSGSTSTGFLSQLPGTGRFGCGIARTGTGSTERSIARRSTSHQSWSLGYVTVPRNCPKNPMLGVPVEPTGACRKRLLAISTEFASAGSTTGAPRKSNSRWPPGGVRSSTFLTSLSKGAIRGGVHGYGRPGRGHMGTFGVTLSMTKTG